jgi:hypothetical protein
MSAPAGSAQWVRDEDGAVEQGPPELAAEALEVHAAARL